MKKKKNSWELTRESYINWLSDTKLRYVFSKKLNYEDLSLWWISKLMEKDNINEPDWFKKLHNVFCGKKLEIKKSNFLYFFLIIRLIKKFIIKIIFATTIKILFKEKNKDKNIRKDCFYSIFPNLIEFKNQTIDRQYGTYSLKKRNLIYFIDQTENLQIFYDCFKIKKKLNNISFGYYLLNHHISIYDIIHVYYFTLKKLIILFRELKSKNYFYINKKNVENILREKLISSFFGSIQDQLLKGIALRNCLKKNNYLNFINCFDFYPQSRALYYFAKTSGVKNVININHVNYSENNIFLNCNKSDFSNKNLLDPFFSPQPDIYFCQGAKYSNKLRKVLKKTKIFTIGSPKIELNKYKIANKRNTHKKFTNSKKTLVILCSINDYRPFIKLLNQCDLSNFKIVVAPHPHKKKLTLSDFKKNFNNQFISDQNMDKSKLIKNCDYIIFGDTSLGLELSILGYNVFRVYDEEFIPTFDLDKEVPTATNPKMIENFLRKKSINQKSSFIERNYFYKYDKKASDRFEKFLRNFNSRV